MVDSNGSNMWTAGWLVAQGPQRDAQSARKRRRPVLEVEEALYP